jgi:molybdopterin converting factor small subunit
MPTLRIPSPLRNYTDGQSEIDVRGQTVAEAMSYLVKEYPALQPHLYNEQGGLRPFVNIFLGEENVKDLQGPDTPLRENDRLLLIPSIAGGAPAVEKTLTKRK